MTTIVSMSSESGGVGMSGRSARPTAITHSTFGDIRGWCGHAHRSRRGPWISRDVRSGHVQTCMGSRWEARPGGSADIAADVADVTLGAMRNECVRLKVSAGTLVRSVPAT